MTDPRARYQLRIARDTAIAADYRAKARSATNERDRRIYQHAAESRERMIATHAAKLAALEPVTACQRSMFEEAA